MSATIRGQANLDQVLRELPEALRSKFGRGALRVMAEVIADEAQVLTQSDEVRDSIKTSNREQDGLVTAKVKTVGPGAYLAPWEEFGTALHIIRFKGAAPAGKTVATVRRLNSTIKEQGAELGKRRGSLKIGNSYVGNAVIHPGARAHPFMRPALDNKFDAAVDAAADYIRARIEREGLGGPVEANDGDDA